MGIILLLIAILGVTALLLDLNFVRASALKAVLLFSLLVLSITELLSLFNGLNYFNLVLSWTIVDLLIIYFIVKRKSLATIPAIGNKIKATLKNLQSKERLLAMVVILIAIGVLLQGLIYPTNNWDSMTYHMARIIHWIQNESLAYYRTPVYAQINSPPFAEEFILNVNLLAGHDYFSNTVQWFYLLATGVAMSLVAKQLGLNRLGQLLTVFVMMCLPEAILLGSSTHNELVLSFFLVTSIYFFICTIKEQTIINGVLLGCSLGLAAATKSTAYIYLLPFVVIWLGVMGYLWSTKNIRLNVLGCVLVILSFVVINSGHYGRNYKLTGNLLGTNETIDAIYLNEGYSFGIMISNVTKNVANQFGLPKIAPVAYQVTNKIHDLINEDINNPLSSYAAYEVDPLAIHENNGANPYHAILILLSLVWMLITIRKQSLDIKLYWIAIVLSFLVFCFLLKWQPWVKIHLPFFVFYAIVLAHFLYSVLKSNILFYGVLFGFMTFATASWLFNYSRPIITYPPYTSTIKINDTRYKKYFSRFLEKYHDYEVIRRRIAADDLKNIGLLLGDYDMEYQLFIESYQNNVRPIHINSAELTDRLPVQDSIDCLVSTQNKASIVYQHKTYLNVTQGNDGHLFLFLKEGF